MIHLLAAIEGDAALAFVEIGAVVLILAVLAAVGARLRITAIPLFLVAGLAVGQGGITELANGEVFLIRTGEIGVLLLLFTLGLEYSAEELRHGLRTGTGPGLVDATANFVPGLVTGLLLGWDAATAIALGGITWISSSGIIAKVLGDLRRLGNRETPSILNVLVMEDLAMAVYLPVVAALIAGGGVGETALTVGVALVAVTIILFVALGGGERFSALLAQATDESLLLWVFGLTLVVGGVAQQLEVSSAIGAFLVGLAVSGSVRDRTRRLIEPVRDLFAPIFFFEFAFGIEAASLLDVLAPAAALALVTAPTKLLTGWFAAARAGVGERGRVRAGAALIARGEFSIVIAALAVGTRDGSELGALAAAYVLITAILGPVAAKYADRIPLRRRAPAVASS